MAMNLHDPASPRDLLDAIEWSYRLFLGREPESDALVKQHLATHSSIDDVRKTFMSSDEFLRRLSSLGVQTASLTLDDPALHDSLFRRFDVFEGDGEDGFWTDFLGVKTRCRFLPAAFGRLSGKVLATPDRRDEDIHERAEWIGTLQSVVDAQARGRLVVAELGAGWGPWLITAAKAAEIAGIRDVTLVGVEGAEEHFAFMHEHFADNAVDSDRHRLIHAIVGPADGTARFPRLPVPSDDWGAKARYDGSGEAGDFDEVRCISLDTLFDDLPTIDLVHCDIQGAEADVIEASGAILDRKVRRMIVGTHGREIEARLCNHFSGSGWTLEHQSQCQFGEGNHLVTDGCQIWRNPKVAEAA